MKAKLLVPVLAVTLVTAGASLALAQPEESTLQFVNDLHIVPGKQADFESIQLARNARKAQGGVTFNTLVSVADGLPALYRAFSPGLENMAAVDTMNAQLDAMPAGEPGAARGVIDHIESSIRRTRPDLNYDPDNPRLPIADATFIREIDVYLKFGAGPEFEALVGQLLALYERHDVRNISRVTASVTGSGPDFRFVGFGRSPSDFYAEDERVRELLGGELQSLLGQMGALTRRVEYINRTIRRDLGYQP